MCTYVLTRSLSIFQPVAPEKNITTTNQVLTGKVECLLGGRTYLKGRNTVLVFTIPLSLPPCWLKLFYASVNVTYNAYISFCTTVRAILLSFPRVEKKRERERGKGEKDKCVLGFLTSTVINTGSTTGSRATYVLLKSLKVCWLVLSLECSTYI